MAAYFYFLFDGKEPESYHGSLLECFFWWIQKRGAKMRRAIKKNVTYDPEIFEDVFSGTILKVAEKILAGKEVADFEQYFFLSAKNNYIQEQNRQRRQIEGRCMPAAAGDIPEERAPGVPNAEKLIEAIRDILLQKFPPEDVARWERRKRGKLSYHVCAAESGLSLRAEADRHRAIDRFLARDRECRALKESYYSSFM